MWAEGPENRSVGTGEQALVAGAPAPPDSAHPGFGSHQLRLLLVCLLFGAVPTFVAGRARTRALRAAGLRIGRAGVFWGLPTLVGGGPILDRLHIGEYSTFNEGCFFELEDRVTIGAHVSVGHDVLFLTKTHLPGRGSRRAGPPGSAPVLVGDGSWIGARATILPGVTIGAGAVVSASTVVEGDVADNTLLTGGQRISLARWR